MADERAVDTAGIEAAERLIGLRFTPDEREMMVSGVNLNVVRYDSLRAVDLANSVPTALVFAPEVAGDEAPPIRRQVIEPQPPADLHVPADLEELAFAPVAHLAYLLRTQQVSSTALTEMYLDRLKRFGPQLECVVTLTEELARRQAAQADAEMASGRYRGPLHGIPWGAKDLLATRDYPTTWGAPPFKDQVMDLDATVVARLAEAGAVLVAKLTMGSLAWGDVWFGGKTRNPWNLEEGSSGSSAGSGAATAAGLVGFAIGTETYGSIVSPCTQCGVTGLRPTFGRVSRHGAMALAWSMDKIGPMCRSAEDCALVFNAIYGPDGHDQAVVDRPFTWQPAMDLTALRIGYLKSAFDEGHETKIQDNAVLDVLQDLGARLTPVELPDYPHEALQIILWAETAAAFDELTRSDRDDLLVRQGEDAWPNRFRTARFIPAVEYIQANRIRTLLMQDMANLMAEVDLYVAPSRGGHNLLITNLTGHPAVVMPSGFRTDTHLPTSITFTGRLYDEATVLAVAKAYQGATDHHRQVPPLFAAGWSAQVFREGVGRSQAVQAPVAPSRKTA